MKTLMAILMTVMILTLFAPPTSKPTPTPVPTPAPQRYADKWFGTWVQVPDTIAPVCRTYIKINKEKVYADPGKCWIHTPKKLY